MPPTLQVSNVDGFLAGVAVHVIESRWVEGKMGHGGRGKGAALSAGIVGGGAGAGAAGDEERVAARGDGGGGHG
jgi:hypothetical protein